MVCFHFSCLLHNIAFCVVRFQLLFSPRLPKESCKTLSSGLHLASNFDAIFFYFEIKSYIPTGCKEPFASLNQSANHTSDAPLPHSAICRVFEKLYPPLVCLGKYVITTFVRSLSCLSFAQFENTVYLNTDDRAGKYSGTLLPQPAALWRTGQHCPPLSDRRSFPLTVICARIVQDESTEVLHSRVTALEDVLARCCRLHNQQRFEELGVLLKTVAEASAALGQMVGGSSAGMKGEVERAIRQSEGRRKVSCTFRSFFGFDQVRKASLMKPKRGNDRGRSSRAMRGRS